MLKTKAKLDIQGLGILTTVFFFFFDRQDYTIGINFCHLWQLEKHYLTVLLAKSSNWKILIFILIILRA